MSKERKLIDHLLRDTSSGLQIDRGGRRYFRQRKVEFRTIEISEDEIHSSSLPGFGASLPFLNWAGKEPSHIEIRDFAFKASLRFLTFWYGVFDVAVARALGGRDREIYRRDFFIPSIYVDIGIPRNQQRSSMPPILHRKIVEEYDAWKDYPCDLRIFYLSDYLTGLTDDIRQVLAPYEDLWILLKNKKNARSELDEALERWRRFFTDPVQSRALSPEGFILKRLSFLAMEALRKIVKEGLERTIESDRIRNAAHRLRLGDGEIEVQPLLEEFSMNPALYGLPGSFRSLYGLYSLSGTIVHRVRSAATNIAQIHRLEMRIIRLTYLVRTSGGSANTEGLTLRVRRAKERLKNLLENLDFDHFDPAVTESLKQGMARIASVRRRLSGIFPADIEAQYERIFSQWPIDTDKQDNLLSAELFELLSGLKNRLIHIMAGDRKIRSHYLEYKAGDRKESHTQDIFNPKYDDPGPLIPEKSIPGNPFHEQQIIDHVRKILYRRLRPVRMTASTYSTIAGHRHGAMPLNPVMKLWKSRPSAPTKEAPACSLELNNRAIIEVLIRLATLTHPDLSRLKLEWRGIMKEKRPDDGLKNMKFFLLPGSCFPLREIRREDFPEFRNRVIGETRTPAELGVDISEDAILTGAWYHKSNHSLYYPVGGDNGSLLRTIWNGGRFEGPPAFFFALGQFVHDSLPDGLVYYRSGEITFRQCIEDYYRAEDRTRKNRGDRTGRKRTDNSRDGIRFMFAVFYSRFLMEALSGSMQFSFRHRPTERWMFEHLELPVITMADKNRIRTVRHEALEMISKVRPVTPKNQGKKHPKSGL